MVLGVWNGTVSAMRLRELGSGRVSSCTFLSVHAGFDDLHVCADPGIPENGFRTPSGGVFFESSVTRFHCQDGFTLKGSTKRLCMKHLNGTLGWVPSDRPVCVQEGRRPAPQVQSGAWPFSSQLTLHATE